MTELFGALRPRRRPVDRAPRVRIDETTGEPQRLLPERTCAGTAADATTGRVRRSASRLERADRFTDPPLHRTPATRSSASTRPSSRWPQFPVLLRPVASRAAWRSSSSTARTASPSRTSSLDGEPTVASRSRRSRAPVTRSRRRTPRRRTTSCTSPTGSHTPYVAVKLTRAADLQPRGGAARLPDPATAPLRGAGSRSGRSRRIADLDRGAARGALAELRRRA